MDRLREAEALHKEATKFMNPSFLGMRLKGDWSQATPLFERAGLLYKQAGDFKMAKDCFEKAATGYIAQRSPWHAAKAMERAGEVARDSGDSEEITCCYRRAADFFLEEGRPASAAEAVVTAAKSLEMKDPATASKLYTQALEWLEDAGKDALSLDYYRQAAALAVTRAHWADAVAILLRFAAVCERSNATNSLCKSYLGAVVVWLYAGEGRPAWQTYQDALSVTEFSTSEEALAAEELLEAYRDANVEAVAGVIKRRHCFTHLDPYLARLAKKLPPEDIKAVAASIPGDNLLGVPHIDDDEEEDLT